MAARLRPLLVDIHSHVYLPRYASLLRARKDVPRIFTRTNAAGAQEDRLVILTDEPTDQGRPVGPQYWDRQAKLQFMDQHGIDCSVISSANPWLDFLSASDAYETAQDLNRDLEEYCATSPAISSDVDPRGFKRLYGFGLLPLVPGISVDKIVDTVRQIEKLPHLRGIIIGTRGLGDGLDDDALDPVWEALEKARLVSFIHPHYGIGKEAWGKEQSHVLPLALGFPFETTIAITRMILAGVLDRHPNLRILLAHSGGVLPQLSSRLASCIAHDPVVASRLRHDARAYLGMLYYDAVAYGSAELAFVADVAKRGRSHLGITTASDDGTKRLLWGTDHPFFPPLEASEKWRSVVDNLDAIDGVETWNQSQKDAVRGGNAVDLFFADSE
ncbi:amidohydrolase 2 [Exidia glandulosa HHB12029]|uniref:Amidohydrolase 2 n=1 Tax=Exidia glandulosa HHB12029 TaxID=1314781 RepID=A0A165R106_EXIGL|nr:amidohydrolase 2 [Exidia glandulosa HHB12029]